MYITYTTHSKMILAIIQCDIIFDDLGGNFHITSMQDVIT